MLMAPHNHLSEFTSATSVGAGAFGTAVTSGGSAHTYGSWTQIKAALNYASEYCTISLANNFTSLATQNAYVDIGIGTTTGDVLPIIEKLCGSHAAAGFGRHYFMPIRIPSGLNIYARHQNTVASKAISVQLNTFGGNMNPGSYPNFGKAVAIGATTASTTGTAITPGATGAEGSWTQIIASTTSDYGGLMISGLFNVDTSMTSNLLTTFDIGIGASGQEKSVGENILVNMPTSNDERAASVSFPTLIGVPVGSRIAVRASGSGTADSSNSVIVLGFAH